MLSMPDIDLKKVVEPGDFRMMIGASSKDIRLRGIVTVIPLKTWVQYAGRD